MIKAHIPLTLHHISGYEFRLTDTDITLIVGTPIVIDERGFMVSQITLRGDRGTNFKVERQPNYDVLQPANRIESGKTSGGAKTIRSAFEGGVEAYGLSVGKYIKSTDGFLPTGDERPKYKYWFIETLDHTQWARFRTKCIYLAGIDTHEFQVQQKMEELSRDWDVPLKEEYISLGDNSTVRMDLKSEPYRFRKIDMGFGHSALIKKGFTSDDDSPADSLQSSEDRPDGQV